MLEIIELCHDRSACGALGAMASSSGVRQKVYEGG